MTQDYKETLAFYKSLTSTHVGMAKEKVPRRARADMTDAELVSFYSERYTDVDIAEFLIKERQERLYGLCNLVRPGEFYLDVGCANGGHMEVLYQMGINGIGLDLSVANIVRGREKYPHLKFVHGFAEAIPFQDNYFDIAILGDVIEHFRNPKASLAECLRVSRKGIGLCIPVNEETTAEHISPFSYEKIRELLQFFKLDWHLFDFDGREIAKPKGTSKLATFTWAIIRAEKTGGTEAVLRKVLAADGVDEHKRTVGEILGDDEWCYNTEHQRDETHRNRFKLLSHLIEGQKVLEIGCGNGDLSVDMAKVGFDVVGIDISGPGVSQATDLAKKENLDAKTRFMVMDATSLEFHDNSFDSILIPEVLEHFKDSRKILKEAVRAVRNGGRIIVSVPNGLLVPFPGHLRVFFKDTLLTELGQYAEEITWHELPFKKWLICSFFVRKKELDITEGPTIDILMPTFNGRGTIGKAIKSVLDQTYQNWKLTVVNDSGEDVKDILEEFNDGRIRYIWAEHKGKSHALNIGIANSTGEFIGYLDDDDILYPVHFEVLIKAALGQKKDFVYTDWYEISFDDNKKEIGREFSSRQDIPPWMLITQNYINHKCILHSRSLLEKAGRYDEQLDLLIDWDMIRRLAFISPPYHSWEVTSEHMMYYSGNVMQNRISSLWTKDPDKARRSMEIIIRKTVDLAATTEDVQKAVVHAMLHRTYYHSLEFVHALRAKESQMTELEIILGANDAQISGLESTLKEKDAQIDSLNAQIQQMQREVAMQLLKRYRRVVEKVLRTGTRRRYCYELLMKGIRVTLNEGWRSFWFKFGRWLRGRKAAKALKHALRNKVFARRRKRGATQATDVLVMENVQPHKNALAAPTGFETMSTEKLRVAFVGQAMYFRSMYESDLDRYYEVNEFELKWGADAQYYKGLIEFNPHIAFFFRPELYPTDLLTSLRGIKVALSSESIPKYINGKLIASDDMKLRFESLKEARAKNYDAFFHYDSTSLKFLKESGFEADEFCFPVATGTYRPIDCRKKWEFGFMGRDTPHRESFLGVAKRDFNGLHIAHGIYSEDFVQMMNQCRIGINLHVDENVSLEPRIQMMMACKVMVMSEPLSHNNLFKPGLHYIEFTNPEEFWEKLKYYLEHEEKREEIALNGYRLVREKLDAADVFHELINRLLDKNKHISDFEAGRREDMHTEKEYLKLDLGCGKSKKKGFIGVDIEKYNCVDIVADLNQPLPFRDSSVKEIFCSHTLEHMKDPYHLLDEMYRVCISDAVIELVIPLNQPDPTHLTVFDETWFENNLDSAKFGILSSEARFKSGISPSGKFHSWHEQKVLIKVLKEGSYDQRSKTTRKRVVRPSVAFVIPNASISGGTMVICQQANRLVKKGYDVLLVDQDTNDQYKLDWFPNLPPEVIPINKLDSMSDIAIATHWSTAYTVKDLSAKRKLYFVQSDETRFNPPDSKETELARKTYTFDFEFVVIARWLQKWLEDSFGKTSHYVPNGVDPSIFYPDVPLSPKSDRLRILLEGPIDTPFKGMEDAFKVVDGVDCEVWCVSTFGRPKPGWKCDRFFNGVPQEMMRKIYSSCDILIKMSRVEGFFLPPLEMMACGGTVITGKVTGYDEYVVDGYNGLVVEQGDVEDARKKLKQLIEDRELLEILKKGGVETAKNWNWDYSSDQFEKVIVPDA